MSKRKNLLLASMTLCLMPLAACSGNRVDNGDGGDAIGHAHVAATSYKYDENGHYHSCDKCDENVRFNYALHEYEEKDGVRTCKVCGYSYTLPIVEYDRLAKIFVSGIKNYVSYDGDLSCKMVYTINKYENELPKRLSTRESDLTYGATNNLYCLQETDTKAVYDYKNETYSSSESLLSYVSGDDANGYKYFQKNSDTDKTVCEADNGVARLELSDFFSDYELFEFPEAMVNATNFDDLKDDFGSIVDIENAELIPSIALSDDGTVTYAIEIAFAEVYDNEIESYSFYLALSVKDDFVSALNFYWECHQLNPSGHDEIEYETTNITFQKEFDQALYESNKPDESEYEASSQAYSFSIPVFLGEYELSTIYTTIGEKHDWSSDYYHTYADLYIDKDCTIPYTDQVLDTSYSALYVKPLEPASDQALVWELLDRECLLMDFNFLKRKKLVLSVNSYSAPCAYSPNFTYHGNTKYCGTKLTLDGKEIVGQFTLEAGKIYFLYWSETTFIY